jgi:cell division protein FtsQ
MCLAVKRVEISGIKHMDRLPVYAVALDQQTTAMPLLDLEGIRQKLLTFGWVADARVSRRLPDTLLVDIVERQPVAIWQYRQKLNLIDKDGRVLAPVDLSAMPDLPVLIGPDANMREGDLAALLEAAPPLKPMIAGASWIGGRRWDVRFQSGETLALPEGEALAKAALAKFQRMDQAARLLGQGCVRFDMRVPGKFFVRVSKEPGSAVGAPQPKPQAGASAAPTPTHPPAAHPPADVI